MSLALLWSYSPIVLSPAAAIILVVLLRRLLGYPRKQPATVAPPTSTDLVPAEPGPVEKVTWEDITAHRGEFVTTVVPVFASGAILLLGIWPFVYLGWGFMVLTHQPGAAQLAPPWFGNFGYFLGLGLLGLFWAVVGLLAIVAITMGLHALGKCIIWPALCGCGLADADDAHPTHDH